MNDEKEYDDRGNITAKTWYDNEGNVDVVYTY